MKRLVVYFTQTPGNKRLVSKLKKKLTRVGFEPLNEIQPLRVGQLPQIPEKSIFMWGSGINHWESFTFMNGRISIKINVDYHSDTYDETQIGARRHFQVNSDELNMGNHMRFSRETGNLIITPLNKMKLIEVAILLIKYIEWEQGKELGIFNFQTMHIPNNDLKALFESKTPEELSQFLYEFGKYYLTQQDFMEFFSKADEADLDKIGLTIDCDAFTLFPAEIRWVMINAGILPNYIDPLMDFLGKRIRFLDIGGLIGYFPEFELTKIPLNGTHLNFKEYVALKRRPLNELPQDIINRLGSYAVHIYASVIGKFEEIHFK